MTIRAENLTKTFRRRLPAEQGFASQLRSLVMPVWETITAVQSVSFVIQQGEIIGYIGANGAGKSTTIKCLTGILTPTSGLVEVAGLQPYQARVANARNIGVVFGQKTQLWWDIPPRATFEFLKVLWNISDQQYQEQLRRLDDLLGLSEFIDVPVRQLSLGQRMRSDLAAAFLHNPPILFLDEPTIGMDLESKERLREFIAEINREQGVTVFLTTHDLEDINKLASRIFIINHGQLIFDGTISEVIQRYVPYRKLVLELAEHAAPLQVNGDLVLLEQEGRRCCLQFPRTMTARHALERLLPLTTIHDFTIEEPSIEDVVRILQRGDVAT